MAASRARQTQDVVHTHPGSGWGLAYSQIFSCPRGLNPTTFPVRKEALCTTR